MGLTATLYGLLGMTRTVSNEDILRALVEIGGGLHREFSEFRETLLQAARTINEQKFEEAKLLTRELEELSKHIINTKREIALIHATSDGAQFVSANFELETIVKQTEDATNNIMTAAETIDALSSEIRDNPDLSADQRNERIAEINTNVTRIFEHCNFQDITGQRINKVVKMLSYVETRIENMISIWGESDIAKMVAEAQEEVTPTGEAALLNGPQLPGNAVSQDDIDKLF